MKKQIVFDLEMIPAVIEGRKTLVRYPMDQQPRKQQNIAYIEIDADGSFYDDIKRRHNCPYGLPNDVFFLRDRWRKTEHGYELRSEDSNPDDKKWRGQSVMPKAAAKHWLRITGIFVERLSELSIVDAGYEGLRLPREIARIPMYWNYQTRRYNCVNIEESLRTWYAAKHPDANGQTWCWVISFELLSGME